MKTETIPITATPDDSLPDIEPMLDPLDPLKIPGLGLAIEVEPKVGDVAAGSPAAKAGITPGAVLSGMTFPVTKDSPKGAKPKAVSFAKTTEKDVTEVRWPDIPRRRSSGSSSPLVSWSKNSPSIIAMRIRASPSSCTWEPAAMTTGLASSQNTRLHAA